MNESREQADGPWTQPPFHLESALKLGWSVFAGNALCLILSFLIFAIISAISVGIAYPAMWLGFSSMTLKAVRGEPIQVLDVFSGMSFFLPATIMGFLTLIGIFLGMICLILPGLYLMVLWNWIFLCMADGTQGVGDCISASTQISKSDFGAAAVLVFLCVVLYSVSSTIQVASLVVYPLIGCISAVCYERWRKQHLR